MVVAKWVLVPAALLLLSSAPAPAAAPANKAVEPCRMGTKLGADGHVADAKNSFGAGEPVYITVRAPKRAERQQLTVEIDDASGEEMKSLFKMTNGQETVTFPVRNLAAGRYAAKATWGKQNVCRQAFEIH